MHVRTSVWLDDGKQMVDIGGFDQPIGERSPIEQVALTHNCPFCGSPYTLVSVADASMVRFSCRSCLRRGWLPSEISDDDPF